MVEQSYKLLLENSSIIENAAYAVHDQYTAQGRAYVAGSSKCGSSSCASQSKCGNSKASSVAERTVKESILEQKV